MKRFLIVLMAGLPLVTNAQGAATEVDVQLTDVEQLLAEAAEEIALLGADVDGDKQRHIIRKIHRTAGPGRAMLGINIGRIRIERDDGSTEVSGVADDGVEINGVTPGGPADQAGLESGDVIVSLNGESLAAGDVSPERRLLQLMSDVEPGDTVQVGYRRGERELNTGVVTREFEHKAFSFGGDFEELDVFVDGEHLGKDFLAHLPRFMHRRHGVWRGMELVPLTPKLGSYFGADSGLLVVRAPADDEIPLEEGDVILQIAGATPESPPEAMRLLRFYEPGDQVVIEVLRQKRNRTFKVTVPELE